MAGEGACFLHVPPGWLPRPRATGWFAGFGGLATSGSDVPYATGGSRFMGATFDPSGLYRFNAAMDWMAGLGIDAATIHAHSHALQARFVVGLEGSALDPTRLVVPISEHRRGNFLAFDLGDAEAWQTHLAATGVVVDRRARRLRFGFGLYHAAEDVDELLMRLRRL
jgi:selenocysteine lyase/cysteine desulfurase